MSETPDIKRLYLEAESAIDALEKALLEARIKPHNRSAGEILTTAYEVVYATRPRPDMHQVE